MNFNLVKATERKLCREAQLLLMDLLSRCCMKQKNYRLEFRDCEKTTKENRAKDN